jgi:outer membrane lipoprotein-sorting protein
MYHNSIKNPLQILTRSGGLMFACAIILLVFQASSQPNAMLERSMSGIRSIETFKCAMVRKQTYKGINKTASCAFYHDRPKGKFAYIYTSPFDYSFWIDGDAVCGMNRNKKRGYNAKSSTDFSNYCSLLESIHVCGPLFQFEKLDTLRVSLKASVDDFLYFEYPVCAGREVLKVDRNKNIIVLIETFDSTGAVRRQTVFEYDTTKQKVPVFPKKIITRRNPTGYIQTDTLILTKVEINKGIKESVFAPPPFAAIEMGK